MRRSIFAVILLYVAKITKPKIQCNLTLNQYIFTGAFVNAELLLVHMRSIMFQVNAKDLYNVNY